MAIREWIGWRAFTNQAVFDAHPTFIRTAVASSAGVVSPNGGAFDQPFVVLDSVSDSGNFRVEVDPGISGTFTVSFWFRFDADAGPGDELRLRFLDDLGTPPNPADRIEGVLRIFADGLEISYRDDNDLLGNSAASDQVFSVSNAFSLAVWHHCELQIERSNSGAGRAVLVLDGEELANLTGVTTWGSANPCRGFEVTGQDCQMGPMLIMDDTGGSFDGPLGRRFYVNALRPTANGASSQWAPSAGANFETVDEVTFDASDRVSADTAGLRDLYAFTGLELSEPFPQSIAAFRPWLLADTVDGGGTADIEHILTKSGQETSGGVVTVTEANGAFEGVTQFTGPDGEGLSTTEVDQLQGGFEFVSGNEAEANQYFIETLMLEIVPGRRVAALQQSG